jgi:hypothetical protein
VDLQGYDEVLSASTKRITGASQVLGLLVIVIIVLLLSRSDRRLGWHR